MIAIQARVQCRTTLIIQRTWFSDRGDNQEAVDALGVKSTIGEWMHTVQTSR
jgi:hypothetical protein